MVQAFLSSTDPLLAAEVSSGMAVFAVTMDGYRYSRGETGSFPKVLDTCLLLLWFTQLSVLLFTPSSSTISQNMKLYGGCSVTLVLTFVSFFSCAAGVPWILPLAADRMTDRTLVDVVEGQPIEHTQKQFGFMRIMIRLTQMWGCFFFLLFLAGFLNTIFNTTLDQDNYRTLHHPSSTSNVCQIIFSVAVPTLGHKILSPMLVKYETEKLKKMGEKAEAEILIEKV